ncbi:unnamed protein product [Oncorhynchus mykiss]|uniref:Uncharacterized protein n=1 Tax=Oncorhynchus mykiss TaxID=8022 RepID=A0A060X4E4_ONCMY|nr:unnamed protein product [Oncorhynchus mykiss]
MCVFLLVQGRTPDYDEPLRIEEDTHWASEQTSKVTEGTHIAMINQLKEAVELLQDPNRVSMETEDLSGVQLYPVEMVMVEDSLNGQDSDGSEEQTTPKWDTPDGGFEFQKKRELILERARLEAQLAYQQYETHMSNQGEDRVPGSGTTFTTPPTPPFGLKPRSAPASLPFSPQPCLRPLLTQALSVDKDTPPRPGDGVMHTSGRSFLSIIRPIGGLENKTTRQSLRCLQTMCISHRLMFYSPPTCILYWSQMSTCISLKS